MTRACALVHGRDYVIPEDVQEIFLDVCAHRILLSQQARNERLSAADVLNSVLRDVPMPR
jgi:MoxR-like ATPase